MNIEHQLKSKLAWHVYKEHEVKIKMVHEQWLQLEMKFLLGYNMGGGGGVSNFSTDGETPPSYD